MAEFTHIDLRNARESRKIPRWKLAVELGYSEDVIRDWEIGEREPHPDCVGHIERILEIPGLWHQWMMSHYDSYRERFCEIQRAVHLTAVFAQTEYEIQDVLPLLSAVIRDTLDGKFDDLETCDKLRSELSEAQAAILQALERLPKRHS